MSTFRLLVVEDDKDYLDIYRTTIQRYTVQKDRNIDLVACENHQEAFEKLDKSFDGAIIDLTLIEEDDAGNQVVKKIADSSFRIPIVILTGDPDNWDDDLEKRIMLIDVFEKHEAKHDEILDKFWDIYNTGLTQIMGGRGKIEKTLDQVFLENLEPNMQKWISYKKDGERKKENPERIQNALLRYTLNHLLQLLDDAEEHFSEEVYLYPPGRITTGSMVKSDDKWFIVLSPACDLVLRKDGEFKTDHVLVVEIEREESIVDKTDERKRRKAKDVLQRLTRNSRELYYHWLPRVNFKLISGESLNFEGGFLNFRKLDTPTASDFKDKFGEPLIQISPFFVKDIVSRFSSFYARQGQPNIESEDFVKSYLDRVTNAAQSNNTT